MAADGPESRSPWQRHFCGAAMSRRALRAFLRRLTANFICIDTF